MNGTPLLETGHIALWLLITGLFFPRLALFVAWLGTGTYPPNTLPDLLNFVSWLFFPRFLMAYYIYTDVGVNNLWFWAYLVTGVAGFDTNLAPTMTVGTGFTGKSSLGENLAPRHLVNWCRVAYNKDTSVPFPDYRAIRPWERQPEARHSPEPDVRAGDVSGELREQIRQLVLQELRDLVGSS